jgi:hypothetical protein
MRISAGRWKRSQTRSATGEPTSAASGHRHQVRAAARSRSRLARMADIPCRPGLAAGRVGSGAVVVSPAIWTATGHRRGGAEFRTVPPQPTLRTPFALPAGGLGRPPVCRTKSSTAAPGVGPPVPLSGVPAGRLPKRPFVLRPVFPP